jgi:pimeloyl-ACP methyl ester carboxylesterase
MLEVVDCESFEHMTGAAGGAECGYLSVPENRAAPASRTIKIAYAILKATSTPAAPDPVVYLTGGPGDSAIDLSWADWWVGPLAKRDLILIDPRGVGNSQPRMQCPWKPPTGSSFEPDVSAPGARRQALAWAQACRDQLVSQGFDLTAYNSLANAGDLEDLRQALGYTQWNLYGVSYGTRTALVTMRAYPHGLRSVVLDALLPPQVDRVRTELAAQAQALEALFAACSADPACRRDYPGLEQAFSQILQRAEQSPMRVKVTDPVSGEPRQIWISGVTLFAGLTSGLMRPWLTQIMPLAITQIDAGNPAVLDQLAGALVPVQNQAFAYSVHCHDGGTWYSSEANQAVRERFPMLAAEVDDPEMEAICQV